MSTDVTVPSTAPKPKAKGRKTKLDLARRVHDAALMMKAASDPSRARTLLLLLDADLTVSELTAALEMTQPAVSHHLALLVAHRLIEAERAGKYRRYRLTDAGRRLAEVVRDFTDA